WDLECLWVMGSVAGRVSPGARSLPPWPLQPSYPAVGRYSPSPLLSARRGDPLPFPSPSPLPLPPLSLSAFFSLFPAPFSKIFMLQKSIAQT
ncbi:hypothetical protein ACLOJK_004311, partial [Asimina triloba]